MLKNIRRIISVIRKIRTRNIIVLFPFLYLILISCEEDFGELGRNVLPSSDEDHLIVYYYQEV